MWLHIAANADEKGKMSWLHDFHYCLGRKSVRIRCTCVRAPLSADSWVNSSSAATGDRAAFKSAFLSASSSTCLDSSVLMNPGCRLLEVAPVPFKCAASSLENRTLASLLWPYALLSKEKQERQNYQWWAGLVIAARCCVLLTVRKSSMCAPPTLASMIYIVSLLLGVHTIA